MSRLTAANAKVNDVNSLPRETKQAAIACTHGSALHNLRHSRNVSSGGVGEKRRLTGLVPAENDAAAYAAVLAIVTELLELGRQASARSVTWIMMTTYWEIGRQIVEFEQVGKDQAAYDTRMIAQL